MNLLDTLFKGLINAPTPLIAVLIFAVIIAFLVYLLVTLAMKPGEGYQTLVTNLSGDYRASNTQVIYLTEQLGVVKTKTAKLEMEVEILTQRAATSDLNAKESKTSLREALDKIDVLSQELVSVRRQLDESKKLVIVKDGRIAELEAHAAALQAKVDSMGQQIIMLQSVQITNLGETKS